jgi:hypothetical protein
VSPAVTAECRTTALHSRLLGAVHTGTVGSCREVGRGGVWAGVRTEGRSRSLKPSLVPPPARPHVPLLPFLLPLRVHRHLCHSTLPQVELDFLVEERKLMQLQLVECAARKYLEDGKAQCRRLTQAVYEAKLATNEVTKQLRAVKVRMCVCTCVCVCGHAGCVCACGEGEDGCWCLGV